MPGYYPMMSREPVAMAQVYPPARSYSLAKLNQPQPRDYGLYEKVKVDRSAVPHGAGGERRSHRMFEGLRRQQSYDGGVVHPRPLHHSHSQPRRLDGFDSLQLLGAHNDDRYLDKFMENSRNRRSNRDTVEHSISKSNSKNTLLSTKSSKSSSTKNNKENNNIGSMLSNLNVSTEILALLGSLANSSSVDNIYESVEQINYRKTLENMNRREKVRSVHRTGHPLFDHLREERALASDSPNNNTCSTNTLTNSKQQRVSRSAGPSRKTSGSNSPTGLSSSNNSSGDEQDQVVRRNRKISAPTGPVSSNFTQQRQQHEQRKISSTTLPPSWRRGGSAGSESDEEWVIPRPKIGGRRRETRKISTDESDSSTKSGPLR